jgi:beta-phosphoglucomutase-like phosphatase (HAD superfamily)
VFEDAPAGIQAAEAAGAALVVVTAAHSGSLDTSRPTITGYGKLTAALLRSRPSTPDQRDAADQQRDSDQASRVNRTLGKA